MICGTKPVKAPRITHPPSAKVSYDIAGVLRAQFGGGVIRGSAAEAIHGNVIPTERPIAGHEPQDAHMTRSFTVTVPPMVSRKDS